MEREKKIEVELLDKERGLQGEVFEKFGGVEDVAATRTLCGDLSNPLLAIAGYEDQVMERLRKAGMNQKR
ncbi:hypothetical protein Bca52824_055488 [Brassica carinata]|uniref:Uncharacterized protein n=1 Tax=Brassica carinata TaxID=52824 RepID=A0A8X7RCM5_BRACI|nr:hypothetical protein Bca52824_055488 [Brassica carinata]